MTTRNEYLNYNMNPGHTMMVHISSMNNMRLDLRAHSTPLTNEQSIEGLMQSLPDHWDCARFDMRDKIKAGFVKNFFDVACELKLLEERCLLIYTK